MGCAQQSLTASATDSVQPSLQMLCQAAMVLAWVDRVVGGMRRQPSACSSSSLAIPPVHAVHIS